ncbi:MAG: hypothetical protein ACK42K_02070, partial [Leptonema sp. (in: bacteria)]
EKDPFANGFLVLMGLLPLGLALTLLILSTILTGSVYLDYDSLPQIVLSWFFIMLPFTAFLSITNAVYENGSEEWLKNYQSMAKKLNLMIKNYLKGILDSSFF